MQPSTAADADLAYERYRSWRVAPPIAPRLSVVIPAYNEATRIVPAIAAILAHCARTGVTFEVVVADDGSTDGTPEVVEALGLRGIRVLRVPRNGGKGSAVRRGVEAARGRSVLFTDADLSTPIEELGALLNVVESGAASIAIASRAAKGARTHGKSRLRRFLSGGLRRILRVLTGLRVRDTQCGFKLLDGEVGRELFALQRVTGFSFDVELLYLAHRRGYVIHEAPVQWFDAPGSKVRPWPDAFRFVLDVFLIRWDDLCGRYRRSHPSRTAR